MHKQLRDLSSQVATLMAELPPIDDPEDIAPGP
jgi:hypothetical protein